jgi:hypothetical protein
MLASQEGLCSLELMVQPWLPVDIKAYMFFKHLNKYFENQIFHNKFVNETSSKQTKTFFLCALFPK